MWANSQKKRLKVSFQENIKSLPPVFQQAVFLYKIPLKENVDKSSRMIYN